MLNPKYAQTIGEDGLSIDDFIFFIAGINIPWTQSGTELYPEGTRYYRANGEVYVKQAAGILPAQNGYKLLVHGTTGGTIIDGAMFPFWDTSGTKSCIETVMGQFPFWLSNGTQQNIEMGC